MDDSNVNANIVQARQFQLVDNRNNVLALLGPGPNGSVGLEFFKGDTPRLTVGTDETGSVALSLRDNAGTICARLAVDASGSPTVFTIRDAPDRVRAQVVLDENGGVGIHLGDKSGQKRISLESHADGTSYVILVDSEGEPVSGLSGQRPEDQ